MEFRWVSLRMMSLWWGSLSEQNWAFRQSARIAEWLYRWVNPLLQLGIATVAIQLRRLGEPAPPLLVDEFLTGPAPRQGEA
jgi:hypothetical protein